MTPGLALLVGVLIGAAVVYFLMQARLQERTAVSQHSQNRVSDLSAEHEQALERQLAQQRSQLEAEYEQRITAKVEQHQQEHAQQLAAVEAEYEARLAALAGISDAATAQGGLPPEKTDQTASRIPPLSAPTAALGLAAGAAILPDPWADKSNEPTGPNSAATAVPSHSEPAATEPAAAGPAPVQSTPPPQAEVLDAPEDVPEDVPLLTPTLAHATAQVDNPLPAFRQAAAQALGAAAATSPKDTLLALPLLSKLSKDADSTVRLAAVRALQQSGSVKAVPLLKQSLRDPDGDVVAAASAALSRFKGRSLGHSAAKARKKAKKKRPKNR